MAVRDALLALLTAGPAYGFQLHGGLAARTGGRRAINVGQTYATLDRLTRQKLVEPAGTTDDGLPLHRLTDAGLAAARAWLDGADAAGADQWDETVDRVLIARSLPDCDADAIVAAELERWRVRRDEASLAVASTPADAARLRMPMPTRGCARRRGGCGGTRRGGTRPPRGIRRPGPRRGRARLARRARRRGTTGLRTAGRAAEARSPSRADPATVPPGDGRADVGAQPADA